MKFVIPSTLRHGIGTGFTAGLLFLGVAIMTGGISTTPWAMPDAIAQTIGMVAPADYGFAPLPVIVGIAVHLALSIALGVLFAAIVAKWNLRGGWLVAAGVLFITVETPIVLWGILHTLLSPAAFHYYLGAIPWWGSVAGHYVYALTLGLLLAYHPFGSAAVSPQPAQEKGGHQPGLTPQ